LGDLDRVVGWVRVFGMVNSAPGFSAQPQVIDGFTDLMVALYGEAARALSSYGGWRRGAGPQFASHYRLRNRDCARHQS